MGLVSDTLRKSARGQDCRFQIPGTCSHDPSKVMLCHAPSEFKGMGNKGHDYHCAFGCHECHEALDQHRLSRVEELEYWLRGMMRTQAWWVANGYLVVRGAKQKKSKPPTRGSSQLWKSYAKEYDDD